MNLRLSFIKLEFLKYIYSATPNIAAKNNKMYMPRAGSFANEWTDIKIPDLTKKVPSTLKENARIARIIVQFLNIDFCSQVIRE